MSSELIPPFECNLSIPDIQDSVVGNGHAVGVLQG